MKPLFSVIVPVYNIEKYFTQCLNSIINQTYNNIEVILIDDGSTDKSPLLCDKYAEVDSRIVVIHKSNEGIVKTRQAGVDIATGEFIACIDGDDWISPGYFEKFAEIISLYNTDIICCGAVWAYEDKNEDKRILYRNGLYNKEQLREQIFSSLIEDENGNYFPPSLWAKVIRRDLYKNNQLKDCFVNIGEDSACVKPCIYHCNSMFIMSDCLYFYRQNPKSITKNKKPFNWNGPELIARHLTKKIQNDENIKQQIYRNFVHNMFNVALSQFYDIDRYKYIKIEINKQLNNSFCKEIIKKCKYSFFSKGNLARVSLKYKMIFLIYLFHLKENRSL